MVSLGGSALLHMHVTGWRCDGAHNQHTEANEVPKPTENKQLYFSSFSSTTSPHPCQIVVPLCTGCG